MSNLERDPRTKTVDESFEPGVRREGHIICYPAESQQIAEQELFIQINFKT